MNHRVKAIVHRSTSAVLVATAGGYNAARELAHEWADQLAAGREPTP